jgi:hypothetical protein
MNLRVAHEGPILVLTLTGRIGFGKRDFEYGERLTAEIDAAIPAGSRLVLADLRRAACSCPTSSTHLFMYPLYKLVFDRRMRVALLVAENDLKHQLKTCQYTRLFDYFGSWDEAVTFLRSREPVKLDRISN